MSDASKLPASTKGLVGYGRPPAEHRFPKGKSGNPNGRPRKARSAPPAQANRLVGSEEPTTLMILQEAYRTVKVRDGEKVIEMPVNQAVMRSLLQNALKGNRLAQRDFTMLLRTIEAEQKQAQQSYFEAMATYKWDAEREIARCTQLGIEPPEMVPHPDDIVLDVSRGTVTMQGPFSIEDRKAWDELLARRDEAAELVAEAASKFRRSRGERRKMMWLDEWQHEQRIFDIINDKLPEHYQAKLEQRGFGEGFTNLGESKL